MSLSLCMHQKHEKVELYLGGGGWVLAWWWHQEKPLLSWHPRPPREEEEEEEETQTRGQWEWGGNFSALPWTKLFSQTQELQSSGCGQQL